MLIRIRSDRTSDDKRFLAENLFVARHIANAMLAAGLFQHD